MGVLKQPNTSLDIKVIGGRDEPLPNAHAVPRDDQIRVQCARSRPAAACYDPLRTFLVPLVFAMRMVLTARVLHRLTAQRRERCCGGAVSSFMWRRQRPSPHAY
jgi:hypothetical protein